MTNAETVKYIREHYKAYGIKLNRDTDAKLIEWLERQKEEKGMTLAGLVRHWIRLEIRKEQKYEHQ